VDPEKKAVSGGTPSVLGGPVVAMRISVGAGRDTIEEAYLFRSYFLQGAAFNYCISKLRDEQSVAMFSKLYDGIEEYERRCLVIEVPEVFLLLQLRFSHVHK